MGKITLQDELGLSGGRVYLGVSGLHDTKIPYWLNKVLDLIVNSSKSNPNKKSSAYNGSSTGLGVFHAELYCLFEELLKSLRTELKYTEGTTISITIEDIYAVPDILIKKSMVFSQTALLVFPLVEGAKLDNNKLYTRYHFPRNMLATFVKYEHLIRNGLLIPFPIQIVKEKKNTFSFNNRRLPGAHFGLKITGDNSHQFMSDSKGMMMFPSLNGLTKPEILSIRMANNLAFSNFQSQIESLLGDVKITQQSDFSRVLKETDRNVRNIDAELKASLKRRNISGAFHLGGISCAAFAALAEPELMKYISSVIGASTALNLHNLWLSEKKEIGDFERSGFYMPWLLSRKGGDL